MPRTLTARSTVPDILTSHAALIQRIARTYARNPDDREDIAQEIRLQLWRALPSLDPTRPATTWIYRIALNTAISWHRKNSRWAPVEMDVDMVPTPESDTDPYAPVLAALMARLSPLNRALLTLYLEELSNAEIAEIMGITPTNVATKLTRIRQELREIASKENLA